MNDIRVKLSYDGIGEVLRSKEMLRVVKDVAKESANSNEHVKSFIGGKRAAALIYPNTKKHGGDSDDN